MASLSASRGRTTRSASSRDPFFALYLVSSKTAHRVVGYFEEEAVISYTHYLAEIDEGRSPNAPAPEIAKRCWGLAESATLRDVVLVVRADEAHHRDVNHGFANEIAGLRKGAWRRARHTPSSSRCGEKRPDRCSAQQLGNRTYWGLLAWPTSLWPSVIWADKGKA